MQSETELKTVVIFLMQDQKTAACTLYPEVIPVMAYMGGGGGAPLERPGTIFRLRRIKKG